MSRCFPFPPPGYEKKPRPDDGNLLKKEKLKEKKHKEKKDKEKKESKRKREKERSDGKHKEKKDRREKNKDRKKDKEKDKEKDQEKGSSITVEKKVPGLLEDYNGAKLQQREKEWGKEICSTSEDGREIGKLEGYYGQKLLNRVEQSTDKRNISDNKKSVVQFRGHSEGKTFNSTLLDNNFEDPKCVVGFDKSVADGGKGTVPRGVEEFVGMGWKKDEGMGRFAATGTSMAVETKENSKYKRVDSKMDEHGTVYEASAMAQNLHGSIQNKVSVPKPMEKIDTRMEGKERKVENKQGDKHKSKGKETHYQGKDKNREKEKKSSDKAQEKKEHKKSEKDKIRSSNKNDPNGSIHKTFHLSKESKENAATDGNLKRKDIAKNGFLHADAYRPEKMPKLVSHSLPENGKKLEPSQTYVTLSPHRAGATNNVKVDDKDQRVNGFIGAQKLPVSYPKPVSSESSKKPLHLDTKYLNEVLSAPNPVIPEASKKPPHPDTKYLNEVLSVPQMDEWSGFDDQEWLFDNRSSVLKKSDIGSVRVDPYKHVWAEALLMESADTCALPYVIPY